MVGQHHWGDLEYFVRGRHAVKCILGDPDERELWELGLPLYLLRRLRFYFGVGLYTCRDSNREGFVCFSNANDAVLDGFTGKWIHNFGGPGQRGKCKTYGAPFNVGVGGNCGARETRALLLCSVF